MNSSFCNRYAASGTVWPVSAFPANLFGAMKSDQRLQAQRAWNFFELVESTDAATRVRLSKAGGWKPPATSAFSQLPQTWYPLVGEGALTLYKQGQLLHIQICGAYDWTSQRYLGVPKVALTNVYPAQCP